MLELVLEQYGAFREAFPKLSIAATGLGLILLAALASYIFRAILVLVLPTEGAKVMRSAPLTAAFGLMIILMYAMAGIFAPWIAPYSESEVISSAFAPPDENMLLGADQLGRDMYSRVIFGARNTVGIALIATSLAFLMGSITGLIAATRGGWIDQIMARSADVIMSIPSLIFSLLLLSIFGTSMVVLICIIAVIYTPRVFRLTRAVAGDVVVLSFLGLGIQPPTADWGSMVRENATLISFGEVTPLIPAAAISLLTVAVNFVVDWMLYRSSGLKE